MSLSLTLPWPPSVNAYWRSLVLPRKDKFGKVKHRSAVLLSEEGRDYRQQCERLVLSQQLPRGVFTGRLAVHIVASPPDRRRRDLDNLCKAALDALHHTGLIRDDADIDDLHITRGELAPNGHLRITVTEIAGTSSGQLFRETGT